MSFSPKFFVVMGRWPTAGSSSLIVSSRGCTADSDPGGLCGSPEIAIESLPTGMLCGRLATLESKWHSVYSAASASPPSAPLSAPTTRSLSSAARSPTRCLRAACSASGSRCSAGFHPGESVRCSTAWIRGSTLVGALAPVAAPISSSCFAADRSCAESKPSALGNAAPSGSSASTPMNSTTSFTLCFPSAPPLWYTLTMAACCVSAPSTSAGRPCADVALLPVASAEFGAGVAAACSPLARFASSDAPSHSMDEAPSSLLTLSLMASSSASPSSARLFLGIAPLAEGWNLMGDASWCLTQSDSFGTLMQ
mmetsp:Transcript_5287/g.12718  ORF Transcript_5287/g.12718 Transcript_5287/m.12718 type:complete len:310 (-) Transcript_5287:410-1339(-)